MKKSYLDYAMSVIVSRALPDVRDGLKPVHRRILYAMNELGLVPGRAYKKSATVVGDVLGKYHPHGDSAVYDAMVRMVQDFSLRYPLVDGQGNFGSMDGDAAAAYRYTEARLTRIATEMLADIEKNTVDFAPNFDDRLQEPTVLPSGLPNLVVNGSAGIAVGMATNIPPHNLKEVVGAITALVDDPSLGPDALRKFIKGPDFPTGAYVFGTAGIKDYIETGRGKIIMRARAVIEENEKGNKSQIVVTELPYQVNKARLIERIADHPEMERGAIGMARTYASWGDLEKDTFQWAETAIPAPREGEVLVRTRMLSLDAANRAWMMGKTYRAALEFGQVMSGFAIAEVVESRIRVHVPTGGGASVSDHVHTSHQTMNPSRIGVLSPGLMNHSQPNASTKASSGMLRKKLESVTWLA